MQSRTTPFTTPRILASAAVAGAIAGAAPAADAAPITLDLDPDIEVFDTTVLLDINQDGVDDLFFEHHILSDGYGGMAYGSSVAGLGINSPNFVWLDNGDPVFAAPLDFANRWGQTAASESTALFFSEIDNSTNPWAALAGGDAYLAGQFEMAADGFHQFWVRMSVSQDDGRLTLREVGWESDPVSQPVGVPEPTTLSLSLMALGAAGANSLRRRAR